MPPDRVGASLSRPSASPLLASDQPNRYALGGLWRLGQKVQGAERGFAVKNGATLQRSDFNACTFRVLQEKLDMNAASGPVAALRRLSLRSAQCGLD
jgi:hypothetical protein